MNILIICGGGFSSSFLVQNIKKAADKRDLKITVDAQAESALRGLVNTLDFVLITPQLRFNEKKIREVCDQAKVPCGIIPSMDFATMNGEAVIQFVLDTINQKGA